MTDEERVYLNAAAVGDGPVLRQSLEDSETKLNVSCVDYMGRSALHLAIDNENTESIELLLDKLSFECIEESLLHAISKGSIKTVKMIIEHPSYMAGENKVTTEYCRQASIHGDIRMWDDRHFVLKKAIYY